MCHLVDVPWRSISGRLSPFSYTYKSEREHGETRRFQTMTGPRPVVGCLAPNEAT